MFLTFALALGAPQCVQRPQIRLVAAISRTHIVRRGASFRAAARITLLVRARARSSVSSDPGMRAHMDGYYTIARSLAQRSDVRSVGNSQAQARSRLLRAAATLAHDANAEYARQIVIYDTVTANGRAQSQGPAAGFPGGPNANVYCGK